MRRLLLRTRRSRVWRVRKEVLLFPTGAMPKTSPRYREVLNQLRKVRKPGQLTSEIYDLQRGYVGIVAALLSFGAVQSGIALAAASNRGIILRMLLKGTKKQVRNDPFEKEYALEAAAAEGAIEGRGNSARICQPAFTE